ncbi:carotenoid 1,2-hydratase [Ideonella sp. 4Y11]|uniref:Carotenoid 1,2-hydratase n=1 Tax=Ideonella aquatica TaxID=2824119 RepID=A0A940YKJ3_9BURK|nr:lipocalin-like domain-containing protein [Ideonella aquatica]MBQ0961865.1 carotenoid 1,2-hydratase [Ideonella aquatica]
MRRRVLLGALLATGAVGAEDARVRRGRVLRFPRDHGAHTAQRTEWWYLTGALWPTGSPTSEAPRWGFQITFFRSATGIDGSGRLAPRQLLFAHAALTDRVAGTHLHDQRLARWNGEASDGDHARLDDLGLRIARWTLARDERGYALQAPANGFTLDLRADAKQPLLLQGEAGYSRKGPGEAEASHYVSHPQLAVQGQVVRGAQAQPVQGRAWLDHEWSDTLLAPQAQGWDWVGINLDDGSALTAFQLRTRDGGVLWAGGSWRDAAGRLRVFLPDELRFTAGRRWTSPGTGASYPVDWWLDTPVGRFQVQALVDAQEMDSRASTGTVYWEGLSALRAEDGRTLGWGYLEMTGYAGRLRL